MLDETLWWGELFAKPFMWLMRWVFFCFGYLLGAFYWGIWDPLNSSMDKTSKKNRLKRASLLASDAECHLIYVTFKNWGLDFIDTFEEYSKEGLINNWPRFWIGSEDDENKRITFDRVGDKWKPRTIPPLPEGGA